MGLYLSLSLSLSLYFLLFSSLSLSLPLPFFFSISLSALPFTHTIAVFLAHFHAIPSPFPYSFTMLLPRLSKPQSSFIHSRIFTVVLFFSPLFSVSFSPLILGSKTAASLPFLLFAPFPPRSSCVLLFHSRHSLFFSSVFHLSLPFPIYIARLLLPQTSTQ